MIKPGDVVRLKSGGPRMTVSEYYWGEKGLFRHGWDRSRVWCVWVDEWDDYQESLFETAILSKEELDDQD